jgi:hypothetical protein
MKCYALLLTIWWESSFVKSVYLHIQSSNSLFCFKVHFLYRAHKTHFVSFPNVRFLVWLCSKPRSSRRIIFFMYQQSAFAALNCCSVAPTLAAPPVSNGYRQLGHPDRIGQVEITKTYEPSRSQLSQTILTYTSLPSKWTPTSDQQPDPEGRLILIII